MKLYPSQELCKKLQEAGFDTETYLAWSTTRESVMPLPVFMYFNMPLIFRKRYLAAPTIQEMAAWLTERYPSISFSLHFSNESYFVNYDSLDDYILTMPVLPKDIADEFAEFVLKVITKGEI